jgi:hypothetical protein
MHQQRLFGDVTWTIGHRTVHVVPRTDMQGYRIRIRWTHKLGIQLDNTIMSRARAVALAQQIALRGRIDITLWKKIYHPKWDRQCCTTYYKPS